MKIIQENNLWIDTRLTEEEMNFLNDAISEENIKNWISTIAHNIHKTELIVDKDNWFFKSVIKKLTERMFYRNWENFSRYHIGVEEGEPLPEFEMDTLWVNYQKQHEFQPLHHHTGLYSFVVFIKIPTHWKDQHALPISANSSAPSASDFSLAWSDPGTNEIFKHNFALSPEDDGRMLFFPGWLQHQVYPFYECEEERVTISGNIRMYDPTDEKNQYERKIAELKKQEEGAREERERRQKRRNEGL